MMSDRSDFFEQNTFEFTQCFDTVPFCAGTLLTILIYFDEIIFALAVYAVACATDLLDGFIARKRNMITEEGMLLDPLADKLMAVFAVVAFTVIGVLPWYVLAVLMLKELLMVEAASSYTSKISLLRQIHSARSQLSF